MRDVNGEIVRAVKVKDPAVASAKIQEIANVARKGGDEELLLEAEMLEAWLALQLDTVKGQNSKYEKRLIALLANTRDVKSVPLEISIHDKLGNYYYNYTQRYNKAFSHFLDLYAKVKDIPVSVIPEKYNYIYVIGTSYYHFGDDKNARKFLYVAKDGVEKNGGEGWCIINIYNTLGLLFRNTGEYDSATHYFRKAAAESVKYQINRWVDIAQGNIGITYFMQGKYDEAMPLLEKDVYTSITDGSPDNATNSMLKLAEIYLLRNQAKKAQYLLAKTDSFIHLAQKPYLYQHNLYRLHAWRNKLDGNLAEAYRYSGLALAAKDTLAARMNANILVRNENKLQAALHEADVQEMKAEAGRLDKSKQQERLMFLIIAVLLGSSVTIVWRNYKRQKYTNHQLATEKHKADELMTELQESIVQKDALAMQVSVAAEMKTRFLANISHELRTPVTLLTGMLEIMRENETRINGTKNDNAPSKGAEQLEIAYKNSRKLQQMVEEILDLSRLETSRVKFNAESKEITPLLRRIVYAFETLVEKKHLSMQFIELDTQGVYILADENMLEKIVNNLVYNAIKFNEPGGWIKVTTAKSADGKQFIFSIGNSGTGIKEPDLPHIFERFYQGSATKAKAEGVGIGLSLVKEFTLLMDGQIHVTSAKKEGTTFTLQFPVTDLRPIENNETNITMAQPVQEWDYFPKRHTILIVEDKDDMRYYLRAILGEKVNLAECANGKEALDWLKDNKADMVITDMMMPEMDGEELVTRLKKNEHWKKMPIITLTALADAGSRLNMLRLGIDDYIVKPFDATELKVRVYNLLTNLEERRQFESDPAEQEDILVEGPEADEFRQRVTAVVLTRMKTIDVSVHELANEMAVSERQLYRLAKSLTGCTPAQLIKEVKLQRAYELLLTGDIYKVEDVAKQVGFEDANYFSRQFLERFGKRPTQFL